MPHIRFQRRSLALAAGSLLLAAQLSACGFSNATDEIYQASAGVDYRKGPLDVLSAVVVSAQEGSGTFIATFSNNESRTRQPSKGSPPARRTRRRTRRRARPSRSPASHRSRSQPGGFVNLADDPSIVVQGEFSAGQYVELKITFDNTDAIEMSVPVVAAANQYEGLDVSGDRPSRADRHPLSRPVSPPASPPASSPSSPSKPEPPEQP